MEQQPLSPESTPSPSLSPSPSPKQGRTGPRTSALNLVEWEEKRSVISELYRHNTLQETRSIMSKKYGFHHSEKLFKEKLNEWGLCKYMPISTAIWMLEHEKGMRYKGKRVVYTFGGCRVNMAEVRRKARRAKVRVGENEAIDPIPPPNIEYSTAEAKSTSPLPESIISDNFSSPSASVQSDDSVGSIIACSPPGEETSSQTWTPPERYTMSLSNLPSHHKSSQDLLEIYHQGLDIWHQTRSEDLSIKLRGTQDASLRFHEALFGFNFLHSPNDLKTRGAAYHLAECYAQLDKKEEFIAVLDWLGKELVRCGNKDDQTNAHVVRVMDLFRAYGAPKEAVALLHTSLAEPFTGPAISYYFPLVPDISQEPPFIKTTTHHTPSYLAPPAPPAPPTTSPIHPFNKQIPPEAISEYLDLLKTSLNNSATIPEFENHLDSIKETIYGSKGESTARLLLRLFMICHQICGDPESGRKFLGDGLEDSG